MKEEVFPIFVCAQYIFCRGACVLSALNKNKMFGSNNKKPSLKRRRGNEYALERQTSYFKNASTVNPSRQKPSDYVKSLLAPSNFKGMKIPDLSCYPTTTHSEEEHIIWTTNPTSAVTVIKRGVARSMFADIDHATKILKKVLSFLPDKPKPSYLQARKNKINILKRK